MSYSRREVVVWWLWLGLALGAPSEEDVDLELEVVAEDVAETREAVSRAIRDQGYLPGLRIGQRTVYFHPQPWKGRVVVRENTQEVRVHIPAAIPLGVQVQRDPDGHAVHAEASFLHATRRVRRSMKAERMDRIMPVLQAWRDTTAARGEVLALQRAMNQLGALWSDPESHQLTDRQRCERTIERFRRTLPYGVGNRVRQSTQEFVWEVVQPTERACEVEELMEAGLVSPRP